MKNAQKLLSFFEREQKKVSSLLILTHDYPDPDSIASAFALKYLVEKFYNLKAKIVYGGIISRIENLYMVKLLKIPVSKLQNKDFVDYQKVALVDTQPYFGNNSFPKDKKPWLVIDQHTYVKRPLAELAIIDTKCSATCQILAQALILKKDNIPSNIATSLVYGILSDTFNLYRISKFDVFRVYLKLLSFTDIKILTKLQNPKKPANFFKAIGTAVNKVNLIKKLGFCHLGFIDDPILVAHVADFLATYKGVSWVFTTGRYKGKLYTSLRTEDLEGKAHEVLRDIFPDKNQAGGHGFIAGGSFFVGANLEENIWQRKEQDLTKSLIKRLKIKGKKVFGSFDK